MGGPMSAYWVKFFKNAGFSSEVAAKHAVVFSNNRIQPDMLPDLDKPSLKDMGITLMGDMIAILRYAKKVVEETSCERIMVSTEVSPTVATNKTSNNKTVGSKNTSTVKMVNTKVPVKSSMVTKIKYEPPKKVIKSAPSVSLKPVAQVKKIVPVAQSSRMYSDYIDIPKPRQKSVSLKRKYDSEEEEEGIDGKWVHNETIKRLKNNVDSVECKMPVSKRPTVIKSQKILKKALEQKRTVFNRLGDSMVSSTTNIEFSNPKVGPTFTVTGVGKDVYTRNLSVFNRLGNKDNSEIMMDRNMRNGNALNTTHGILKTRTPLLGTKVIATHPGIKKIGTMRADEEANKKTAFERVKSNFKALKINTSVRNNTVRSNSVRGNPIGRKSISGKLASDSIALSAKSRLGGSKQVTFNKMAMINHARKQGVFSRLGV
ncbi:uncharacterized protein C19orf47 [Copidosoma floridanum]|uniref:uncharacterized protein C19orf47 n=1 Tax=Copidosoma floridanum TaxID=29053 RepID=UPI0006C9943E|nr:uncharacterized protein C19orf47 [Copidosoma floridanum]XP_014216513.1 uncharacterized protein C19orf47 [Copidosoma floridanum]